ncbi:MAG TPA: acyltransferase [Candidatus Methylacidiphilales bacterium]
MRDLSREGKGQLGLLQVLRGLSALAIVLFHLGVYYDHGAFLGGTPRFFTNFASHGALGIDCFFCLSGFLMAWVHGADLGRPERATRFVLRRFVRIYPAYVVLVAAKVIYYTATDWGSSPVPPLSRVLNSLFLLPLAEGSYYELVVKVAWTLTYEVFFYALFTVAIVVGARLARWGAAVWVLSIAVYAFWHPADGGWRPLDFVLSPYHIEFLCGVLVCAIARARSWPAFAGPVLAGLAVAALAGWIASGTCAALSASLAQKAGAGIVFSALILGVVLGDLRFSVRPPGLLLFLGAASYSVYLVHFELLQLLGRIVERSPLARDPVVLGWAFVGVGIVLLGAGFLYHKAVELPAMAWCRKRLEAFTASSSASS